MTNPHTNDMTKHPPNQASLISPQKRKPPSPSPSPPKTQNPKPKTQTPKTAYRESQIPNSSTPANQHTNHQKYHQKERKKLIKKLIKKNGFILYLPRLPHLHRLPSTQ